MSDKATTVNRTQGANLPWLAFYPDNAPARIEAPPYRLLGDAARALAARRGRRQGLHRDPAERHGGEPQLRRHRSPLGRFRRLSA